MNKISLRASVILLFLILYLSSLWILNSIFINSQQKNKAAFKNIEFADSFSNLQFQTKQDSILASEMIQKFRESQAAFSLNSNETRLNSTFVLFVMMLLSITIFIIVFYQITRPLKVLEDATSKIRKGNFSIQVKERGFKELHGLQQSFNKMSSELKSIQARLLMAEKEMIWKELSRILAHEIKNPLTPIRLSVQRLEEHCETNPEKFLSIFPNAARIINQEIDNLQNLAQSFSSFAKNINPDFSEFKVLPEISKLIEPYQHKYKISFNCNKDAKIKFDQTHFYQIVTNILQNAIDASKSGDETSISCEIKESNIILKIKDNGAGIDPDDLEKIFQPYFTKKKKGTGLGLALVKKLTEVNNSEIRVASVLNKGSEFIITIPKIDGD